jgi:thymidine phosphorylase
MVKVGREMGKGIAALITDMNQPLGRTAGNALEVIESIEILRGTGPKDTTELTIAFAVQMLRLAGIETNAATAELKCRQAIADGSALARFRRMVELHGGDVSVIDDPAKFPQARIRHAFVAERDGVVQDVNAESVGRACILLGAGRAKTDDQVDHAVGIAEIRKAGERVVRGQSLMVLHANDEARLAQALDLLKGSVTIGDTAPPVHPFILETIT